jgi:hypothetical protein
MAAVTVGVDIDLKGDSTAIAVVKRVERQGRDGRVEKHHQVRHLERLPEGKSYRAVAARLAEIVEGLPRPTGRWSFLYKPKICMNTTVVGQPVADLLDDYVRARFIRVCLTDGHERTESEKGDEVTLGERWLVSRLRVLLHDERLHLPGTPEAEELKRELQEYGDSDGAPSSAVIALGLAVQKDESGGGLGPVRVIPGPGACNLPSAQEVRARRLITDALDRWSRSD